MIWKERDELSARLHDALSGAIARRRAGTHSAAELLSSAMRRDRAARPEIVSKHHGLVVNPAPKSRPKPQQRRGRDAADLVAAAGRSHQVQHQERLPVVWDPQRRDAFKLDVFTNRVVLCADLSDEHSRSRDTAIVNTYPVEQEHDWPIQQTLNRLPSRYRTLLWLLSSELELSYPEVAGKMALPIKSIGPRRMQVGGRA